MKKTILAAALMLTISGCGLNIVKNNEPINKEPVSPLMGVGLELEELKSWQYLDKNYTIKTMIAQKEKKFEKDGTMIYLFADEFSCEEFKNFLPNMYKKPLAQIFFKDTTKNAYSVWLRDESFTDVNQKYLQESYELFNGKIESETRTDLTGNVNIVEKNFSLKGNFTVKFCQ